MSSVLIPGLPPNLPSIGKARIPETYKSAKLAISECVRIDECKNWADKAEALASYARQAGDSELRRMADRIQARAIRRCGELIREIAPKDTAARSRNGTVTTRKGETPTRKSVAETAGLSLRQKRTALRLANVPGDEFEEAVESEDPPTVTKLSDRGKKPATAPSIAHLKGRDPEEFKKSTAAQGAMRLFVEMTTTHCPDPKIAVRGAYDHERKTMRDQAKSIRVWIDKLLRALEE